MSFNTTKFLNNLFIDWSTNKYKLCYSSANKQSRSPIKRSWLFGEIHVNGGTCTNKARGAMFACVVLASMGVIEMTSVSL